jgi:hypothetical protein
MNAVIGCKKVVDLEKDKIEFVKRAQKKIVVYQFILDYS